MMGSRKLSQFLREIFCGLSLPFLAVSAAPVDFEKDIEPIFVERCLDCHGPERQKGQFRLDRLASLLRGGDSGEVAIVPGNPAESFLTKLIKHKEPDLEMPPKGDPLSPREIARIEAWIQEGANVPERYGPAEEKLELTHWSFLPVTRPSSSSSIDGFVHKKLAEAGLDPSPEADRRTLIRRLYLVMLGVPPTPEEVETFINDTSDLAWETLVDNVLASPRYGERWASFWLDLVRFGETNGFETNRERPNAWHFRDWVISSFNDDKPYDQFVREQIAGDALGAPIGTSFLVAGPYDTVKGQDPKLGVMQRMNELDDMINTTGTAFLGMTLGCARCHNHKFDPVSQKDYYSLQAVFAGVRHADRTLPLSEQTKQQITALELEKKDLTAKLEPFVRVANGHLIVVDDTDAKLLVQPRGHGRNPGGEKPGYANHHANISGGQYTWWDNTPGRECVEYSPRASGSYRVWVSWGAGHDTHTTNAEYLIRDPGGDRPLAVIDQQVRNDGSGKNARKALWSGLRNAGVHQFSPGTKIVLRGGKQGVAITADAIVLEEVDESKTVPEQLALRPAVNAKENVESFPTTLTKYVRFTIDGASRGQPCIDELQILDTRKKNVALASGGAKASSGGDFVHALHKLEHINDGQFGNSRSWIAKEAKGWVQIELPEPVEIASIRWGRDKLGQYSDRLATRYRIEAKVKLEDDWVLLASSNSRLPYKEGEVSAPLYDFSNHPPAVAEQGRAWEKRFETIGKEIQALSQSSKVYAGTFAQPGPTHRLYRGEPDAKREEVGPDAVGAFTSLGLEKDAPEQQRRVALAEWLASSDNPLTARVIANRLWQYHFGTGIVDTPSDFGINGTPPTHPELLDWLAVELMENGWSLKHLHHQILNSHTWKQSNRPDERALKIDAGTRLFWRFPIRRLEAEGIRDAMLATSGVLDLDKMGGPGFSAFEVQMENVRHYHPKQDYGPKDWRRMIYMTKVRQEKDQVFGAFDCPDASMVVPKRSRSTTPLQALNLLNSRFVLQQSDLFAKRLEREGETVEERVERAFELCFQRNGDEAEVADAVAFIESEGLVQFARAMLNANEFVFIP